MRCIHWYDDDSGFISGGWDGYVYCWQLNPNMNQLPSDKEKAENPQYSHFAKNYQFNAVCNEPGSKSRVYASGMDKNIKVMDKGNLWLTFEVGVNVSQLAIMHGNKPILLAGVNENDRPGSIMVINEAF